VVRKSTIRAIIVNVVAWSLGFLWILPFVGLFMTSVRPYSEVVLKGWWSIIGAHFTLKNYQEALFNPFYNLARGYMNSFIVAIPSTIIPVIVAALIAYAISRFSFPLKSYLFLTLVLIMAVPQQMSVIPLFMMLKDMHLLDTLQGLILVHSSWGIAWIAFLLKNYFDMLPREVEEAARVDGASDLQIFFKIVLPLSLPALASAAAIQFTWVWSDFFYALVFLISPRNYVVTQRIAFMKGQFYVDWGLLSAGSILAMLVPLLLYAVLQKYFVRGMVGWTIKG